MREDLEKKIFEDFPNLFKPERPMTEGLMCFGFECGDGWFDLIYRLCEDLNQMELPEGFEVVQVKEKFGGLRFYPDFGTEEIFNRINLAEEESYRTCEVCGKPGKPNKGSWIRTLCKEHRNEK